MALVNKAFSVNITPGMMPPIVHVSEYDVGRAYTVSLLDEQGNTFTIPSGTTASIEGTLNGSVGFTQSATVSNNQVSFTLSESMTAYAGKAWCKIKLTLNSEPIQTCAFILAVDRAGVEAETVIGSSGFQEQINQGVAEYFDNDPPFFELPEGGQSGQALLSDGADGAEWGFIRSGAGLTDAIKQALLDCFDHVAWADDQGETYVSALQTAMDSESEPSGRLPSGYTEYDYITYNLPIGTGTTSKGIIVPVAMNSGLFFETTVFYTDTTHNDAENIFGTRAGASGTKEFGLFAATPTGKLGYWYGGTDTANVLNVLEANKKNRIIVKPVGKSANYPNNAVISVNGVDYSTGSTAQGQTWSPWLGFFGQAISATATAATRRWNAGFQIGETKIRNSDGTLIHDLVPAYNGSFYGLYDVKSRSFYTGLDPTDFVCGNWE